jgi:hypothetical protein
VLKDRYGNPDAPRYEPTLRVVRPPIHVLIDLGALYGQQPHFRSRTVTVPESLRTVVVGQLDAWVLSDLGWFGACRYRIHLGLKQLVEQSHMVPSWVLRPASDSEVEQAVLKGELEIPRNTRNGSLAD